MSMTIPVILLNYNTSADCRKCLSFLARQQGVRVVPVVVDNRSQPGDLAQLKALCADVGCVLLKAEENRGYNAGNNIGLRWAAEQGYEYALIANPDMEFPDARCIARLVADMEGDAEVVVAAPDILGPESDKAAAGGGFSVSRRDADHQSPMVRDSERWQSAWWWAWRFVPARWRPADDWRGDWQRSAAVAKVSGCCLMVRLSFMRQIGFFDEGVFLYCEEAILSRQVERAGRKIWYDAQAHALHRHIKSQKGDPAPRFKAWVRSRIYFERCHNWHGRLQHVLKVAGWHSYEHFFRFVSVARRLLGKA